MQNTSENQIPEINSHYMKENEAITEFSFTHNLVTQNYAIAGKLSYTLLPLILKKLDILRPKGA